MEDRRIPRPKKMRMLKSKIKVMLIAFFDQKGLVHHEFVSKGETVNQYFYQQVLIRLHEPSLMNQAGTVE